MRNFVPVAQSICGHIAGKQYVHLNRIITESEAETIRFLDQKKMKEGISCLLIEASTKEIADRAEDLLCQHIANMAPSAIFKDSRPAERLPSGSATSATIRPAAATAAAALAPLSQPQTPPRRNAGPAAPASAPPAADGQAGRPVASLPAGSFAERIAAKLLARGGPILASQVSPPRGARSRPAFPRWSAEGPYGGVAGSNCLAAAAWR